MALNLPNRISMFRIMLVPFFVGLLMYYTPEKDYFRFAALGIFLAAVFSDAIDGYIARTRNMKTKLGSFLDPIADKLLLSSSFIALAVVNNFPEHIRLPLWVPILVISRDIILVAGALLVHLLNKVLVINPSFWGKTTTVLQMATIIFVLLQHPWSEAAWNAAALFTVISGLDYLIKGNKVFENTTNQRSGEKA